MKKVLLAAAAVCMSFSVFAAMSNSTNVVNADRVVVAAQQEDDFKEVKLEELSAPVQEAVKAYMTEYDLAGLAFSEAKQQTRVSLVSKADQTTKIVFLDQEGKVVEMPETEEGSGK